MSRASTPASDDDRRRDSGEMLFIGQPQPKALKASTVAAFSKYSLRNNLAKTGSSTAASSSTTTPSASLLTPSGNPRKDAAIAAIKRSLQKKSDTTPTSGAKSDTVVAASGEQGKPTLASVMQSFKSGSSPTLSKEARAELESQFRSMENRYKKGILSASDKVKYAQMCAERESARRNGLINKNDQCIVA
ncbi:hypothetical protein QFC24_002844 [Naganishia onofrii]|uniref:Uncharacterized protein n=1 Tax=Naganishia onofrii TaxID=1851511 RepID=A0ACC2XLI7_9TREE|nr:hypothetical protein QFC24_002844 [Naganishia onofrii]